MRRSMAKSDASRRKYLTLAARDPEDEDAPCEVQISFERMQAVGRRSMGHAKECGYVLPHILQQPTAIFEGLRQDEDEPREGVGWRCYCGLPEVAYREDGAGRTPYPDQVYLRIRQRRGCCLQLEVGKGGPG